jgi:hypothetical protein
MTLGTDNLGCCYHCRTYYKVGPVEEPGTLIVGNAPCVTIL